MSSCETSGGKCQPDVYLDITEDVIDNWLSCMSWTPGNQGSNCAEVATREASSLKSRIAKDGSRRRRTTTGTEEERRPLAIFVKNYCTLLSRGSGNTSAFGLRPGWLEHPSPGFTLVLKRRLASDRKSPPARDDV